MQELLREAVIPFTYGELHLSVRFRADDLEFAFGDTAEFVADKSLEMVVKRSMDRIVTMLNANIYQGSFPQNGSSRARGRISSSIHGVLIDIGFRVEVAAQIPSELLKATILTRIGFGPSKKIGEHVLSTIMDHRLAQIRNNSRADELPPISLVALMPIIDRSNDGSPKDSGRDISIGQYL